MRKGLILIIALNLFIVFFSFIISAVPPFQTTASPSLEGFNIQVPFTIDNHQQNTPYTFHIQVTNISNSVIITNETASCEFHLVNSSGDHIIKSEMEFYYPNDFTIFIAGENFTLQNFDYDIYCNDSDILAGQVSGGFKITSNGNEKDNNYLIANFILILVFLGFSILIYIDKQKMSDEKYWNKMFQRYNNKNYVKLSATIIWYNLKKNSYVLHYLNGFVIMLLVYDITYSYTLGIYPLFKILLALYSWGAMFIALILLGNIQEWVQEWKEELEKINWSGMVDGK